MLDVINRVSAAAALTPKAAINTNTTTNGVAVDLMALNNGNNGLVFLIEAGVITDGTYVFKLQDSPDNSTWTDVPAAYVQASGATTWTSAITSGTTLKIGYLGNVTVANRYVRLVVTSTGVTTGAFIAAIALLALPGSLPAA